MEDEYFVWELSKIDQQQPAGTLEFRCGGNGPDSFFPISVDFRSAESICGIHVRMSPFRRRIGTKLNFYLFRSWKYLQLMITKTFLRTSIFTSLPGYTL